MMPRRTRPGHRLELADVAAARAKVGKSAKEEFEEGFIEVYADLMRRVAADHPEWDLTSY